jgi:acetyltransferase
MHQLETLFYPKSIAILGASTNPTRTGYQWFETLCKAGYEGKIYPINPGGGELFGYQFYRSLEEVDGEIDLVINLLSAANTVASMETIGKCGARHAVVFTSGFAEMGDAGKAMQDEMLATAKKYGVRIVGPNCMGIANLNFGINCTSVSSYPKGPIGFISQSGNVGITVAYDAAKYDTGFSKLVFFGNQSDLAAHEFLEYLGRDDDTGAIAMYVEGVKNSLGREFFRVAKAVAAVKPIILIKGGKTPNAARAAISHTASMAGENRIFSAMLKQAGIIEVDTLDQLIPFAESLCRCPLCKGEDIALVGSGGGHSILLTDAVEQTGLRVPPLSREIEATVKEKLPVYAPTGNPVDMTGEYMTDLTLFAGLTDLTFQDPVGFSGSINYSGYDLMVEDGATYRDANGHTFAEGLALVGEVQTKYDRPIICYSPNAGDKNVNFTAQRKSGVPTYASIDLTAACMAALHRRYQILQDLGATEPGDPMPRREDVSALLDCARNREKENLTEAEVLTFLEANHIATPACRMARDEKELLEMGADLGYPLVMKIVSPQIIHKSDVGGVAVNIKNPEDLLAAYRKMHASVREKQPGADIHGVLLVPFVSGGTEIICGLLKDISFGPMLMIGAGGILTEVLSDVAFLVLPAGRREIRTALDSLKVSKMLKGVRGKGPANVEVLVDLLDRIGQLAIAYPEIAEADFNPIIVNEKAATIADGRIILR